MSLNASAQFQSEKWNKWNFNFQLQDEYFKKYSGPYSIPELLGSSPKYAHFNGWSAGFDRKILSKNYFSMRVGLNFSQKSHVFTEEKFALPFTKSPQKDDYYYLSAPITFSYNKSMVFKPFVALEYGQRLFEKQNGKTSALFRGPGTNFLAIKPGVGIQISKNVQLSLALNYSAQDLHADRIYWTQGLQTGLQINFGRKKKN